MKGLLRKLLNLLKKAGYLVLEYIALGALGITEAVRLRIISFSRRGADKAMAKCCSELGMEVYALSRQGDSGWEKSSMVQQQLKKIEEAEARIFEVQEKAEIMRKHYTEKRAETRERMAAKRAAVGSVGDDEEPVLDL